MLKVGLSSSLIDEELFKKYNDAGIKCMEISESLIFESLNYDDIVKWANKYNVELWSFHLPFGPFDKLEISSPDKELRSFTMNYFSEIMKKAAGMGIQRFIIHPSGEPISDSERDERLKISCDSLCSLAEKAAELGGTIAVENLPRTCLGRDSSEINKLISVNSKLKVCFDTNHLLKEDISEFIKKVGKNIITVHISDYDIIDEKHWLPGEGKIDWNTLYKGLLNVGYTGPWMYEVSLKTPKTIKRDRELDCFDFVRNAKEIFEGKPLTVFGIPTGEPPF